jgi:hypothetical protein
MGFMDDIKGVFTSRPDPLTPQELSRLDQLRQTIRDGIRGWVAAGEALREVKDRQLYRASAPTFEVWAEAEFGLSGRRLNQLTDAATQWAAIAAELPAAAAAGPPRSERTIRELRQLPAAERAPAYAEALAVATSTADEPTPPDTKTVAEVVRRRKKATGRKATPKALRLRVPGATVAIEWNAKGDGDAAAALRFALDQLSRSATRAA